MTPVAEPFERVSGSFRDPSGSVFSRDGRILRQINNAYRQQYDHLLGSGLYRALVDRRLLVPHTERPITRESSPEAYKVVEPERIPFVSYPFEWSFSQLKAAALATLDIHRLALDHAMVLKDASAYNIQFRGADPVLIDTLSFELWEEGAPWVAYRQFCQHFLAPLALMSRTDVRLGSLSRVFIDGVPLDLASQLLPFASNLSPSLLVHLHLHARAQTRYGTRALDSRAPKRFGRRSMAGLVDHLQSAVESLTCRPVRGPWVDYYSETNYSPVAMADKLRLVKACIDAAQPHTVWDLGANTGAFSRLGSAHGAYTVAFDGDPAAVERHYLDCRARTDTNVLPLVMDLTNPTGRIGWSHAERLSLVDRGPADLVLALGLVHHLCLSNRVPFAMVAEFFQRIAHALVIEFIPPTDSQVMTMVSRMPRATAGYSCEAFEREFANAFTIVQAATIQESGRRIYFMRSKAAGR